mmetsp:Transcript_10372/g.11909  ORF Transcript_10372/g.11909 Transcript_10372/m.11909 type:complete len:122 (+) Transcript_10372:217-582(+)
MFAVSVRRGVISASRSRPIAQRLSVRSRLQSVKAVQGSRAFATQATVTEATGNTGVKHRSDAEELISKTEVTVVDGPVALCDGGGGSLGHPIEYIKLDNRTPHIPVECKYCGLLYIMKQHH